MTVDPARHLVQRAGGYSYSAFQSSQCDDAHNRRQNTSDQYTDDQNLFAGENCENQGQNVKTNEHPQTKRESVSQ